MPPKKSPTKATAATSKSPTTVATAQKASASNPAVSKVDTKPVARTTANRATRGGGATVQRGPSRGGTAGRGRAVATRGRGRGGSPAGKQGEQVKGKAGGNDRVKVGKPVWTREDGAARRIQTVYRRYKAKKELAARRKEKEEYDALMDKLQRESWLYMIKMEREEKEREEQRLADIRKRKRESEKRIKRLLEAAFDGEVEEILTIMDEVFQDAKEWLITKGTPESTAVALATQKQAQLVYLTDPNGNTPLSEAASGGHTDCIQLLIDKGSDTNTKGQFERTPIYRAAFAGHVEAVQILLQHGADPRLCASDGTIPEQVASLSTVETVLKEWDCSQTDIKLEKMQKERERRLKEEKEHREKEASRLEDKRKQAVKEHDSKQKLLAKAYEELNKRIFEHDKCEASGTAKTHLTIEAVHEAELVLETAKIEAEEAQKKLDKIKLSIREQEQTETNDDRGIDEVGLKVSIRELDEVLMRDVGDRIKKDGRCPLLLDTSAQSATFLRYRDTNYLNACSPQDMEPESIRLSVLGAIRYGKFIVLDMHDVDMWDACIHKFDAVQPGLLQAIVTKEIMKNEKYLSLIRSGDGEAYSKNNFNGFRLSHFNMVFITRMRQPPDELLKQTYPIRIHIVSESF